MLPGLQTDAPIAVRQDASEGPVEASPLEGEGLPPPPEFENAAKREHLSEAVALKQLRHDVVDEVCPRALGRLRALRGNAQKSSQPRAYPVGG